MAGQELVGYVRNSLASGYSEQQIRLALAKSGYDEYTINEAIYLARQQGYNVQKPSRGTSENDHNKKFIKIVLVIIGIIALVFGAYMITQKIEWKENSEKVDPDLFTTTMGSVTTTTLFSSSEEGVVIFEQKICDDVDQYFNCFENRAKEVKRGDSVYLFFKVMLYAAQKDGSYRVGFVEDRRYSGPQGDIAILTKDGVMDLTREVPSDGQYSLPVFNEITTDSTMPLGDYKVYFTIRDKYSNTQSRFTLEYRLV